ncbi:hypothetical protein IWW48_004093 [Coemansia sp. RSA 1200]|nr:hypothetical protein IWW48_004093 [Coemansia sp. RSA 1200]
MHEGNGQTIYDYLIRHPHILDMSRFRDRHNTKGVSEFEQSKNVRTYAAYLGDKVLAFKAVRIDHVSQKNPIGSQIYVKHPNDIKFLLLEVSTVQKQLHSVLKNRFDSDTLDNETTFSAFRYCLRDMLKLFQVMNQGVMKMLKVYFEMHEEDMRRALDLYKRFVKLTDRADEYLKIARRFESIFGFTIPSLNHAPLSLSKALEGFLSMSPEERLPTINEMKRNAKKTTPPISTSSQAAGGVTRGNTMHSTSKRAKPDYGLRLKPEILALTGDAPQSQKSEPARSATTKIKPDREEKASAPNPVATVTGVVSPLSANSSGSAAKKADTKSDAAAEIDFIDFFSSIDDEAATATPTQPSQNSNNNNALNSATPFSTGTLALATAGNSASAQPAQTQQEPAMTDFDAMFQALSNPFAATNINGGFGDHSTVAQSNNNNYQQQQQQQLQPFDAFSGASMSTPFASVNATQAVLAPMPFLSADTMTTGLPLQTQTQTQTQNSNAGGFANVSANNPFRQSMYPTQSDALSQQSMIVGQMAQLGIQSPPQQQQQQQAQTSYNPFTQRQTMYLDSSMATSTGNFSQTLGNQPSTSPFGNMSNMSSTSMILQSGMQTNNSHMSTAGPFANTSNNSNISGSNSGSLSANLLMGFPQQQQQQHQQMHNIQQTHGAANQNFQTASAVGGNGNFANFDMFK